MKLQSLLRGKKNEKSFLQEWKSVFHVSLNLENQTTINIEHIIMTKNVYQKYWKEKMI